MSKSTPGGMILAKNKSSRFVEHTIMIPCNYEAEDDMMVISNLFGMSFSIMNCLTGDKKEVYYHLEIDKKSEFYNNFREVMKEMLNLGEKHETK